MSNADPGTVSRRGLMAGAVSLGVVQSIGGFALIDTAAAAEDAPVATTEYGKLRGVADRKVLSFRGVPYAGMVDGANRFLPPTKLQPWSGVRDAVKVGPRAIQAGAGNAFAAPAFGEYFSGGRKDALELARDETSENCLVLNVLTPGLRGKRPVMVYIHGGGFTQGSGTLTLGSDRFVAENDIVLVGVNHRLNVFGYTYLGHLDPKYAESGNAGQLDLLAALQWVKANIANFGGDPANVTIFGESGGGAKVSALLAMPRAKGLFRRAIIESGSSLSVRTREVAIADTTALLAALGLSVTQLDQIATLPPEKVLAAATASGRRSFGPVVDGLAVPHQTWRPAAPPEAAGVALIIGNCKEESTLFSRTNDALFALDWAALKEQEIKDGIPADKVDALIAKYREHNPGESPSDLYFIISADRGARRNAIAQAQAKVAQDDGKVYMYNFAWDTGVVANGHPLRAFHTAELPLAMRLVLDPKAEGLSKQIAGAWAAFARNGDPNHAGLPHWDAYSTDKRATMVFDLGKTAVVSHPAREELELLASVPGAQL